MLVFTHGERGDCSIPSGCGSSLGDLRAVEMQTAANFFHSHLTLWDLPDVMENVAATWGGETLVPQIRAVITAERPSVVYTFDPTHGSTCHPAHRAVAALVIEAIARMGSTAPRLVLVETAVAFQGTGFVFSNASPDAESRDVGADWDYLVKDAEIHASQFTAQQIDALQQTSIDQQRVWLMNNVSQPAAR